MAQIAKYYFRSVLLFYFELKYYYCAICKNIDTFFIICNMFNTITYII